MMPVERLRLNKCQRGRVSNEAQCFRILGLGVSRGVATCTVIDSKGVSSTPAATPSE